MAFERQADACLAYLGDDWASWRETNPFKS